VRPPPIHPALALAALACAGACSPRRTPAPHSTSEVRAPMSSHSIEDVLAAETPALMRVPGVTGTGQGERAGRPILVVFVARRTRALDGRIPRTLGGYPVEIRAIGTVRPLEPQ
jgi:hypothetical protein